MVITPKEAFEAVKKLWPNAQRIVRHNSHYWRAPGCSVSIEASMEHAAKVDWSGTSEFPEPAWRDARPEDIQFPNKTARFRTTGSPVWERKALLNGTTFRCDGKRLWVTEAGQHFGECQVRDES